MQSNTPKLAAIGAAVSLSLAACVQQPAIEQPKDAPVPTSADMTFVDAQGCSWWVIGNATSLSWAPMTDGSGARVCDEGRTRLTPATQSVVAAPVVPAPVVEAAPLAEPAPLPMVEEAPVATTAGSYIVQVASFAEASNATASVSLFNGLGIPTTNAAQSADGSGLYRLQLGPFSSRDAADSALARAKTEGFADAFIKKQ